MIFREFKLIKSNEPLNSDTMVCPPAAASTRQTSCLLLYFWDRENRQSRLENQAQIEKSELPKNYYRVPTSEHRMEIVDLVVSFRALKTKNF